MDPKFDILLSQSEIESLPPHMQAFLACYTYPCLERPELRVFNCDDGRFMNHSLTPNTDFRAFYQGYALVDIAPGEELTCNYHEFDPTFTGFFPAPELLTPDPALLVDGTGGTPLAAQPIGA